MPLPASHHDDLPRGPGAAAARRKKNRKAIDRELEEQARQRRIKTRENRRRNPVPLEEEWVCDFCIYERIWGKPTALIRIYEERERRERIAEMNKKRRLEQVKARSRKNKKQPKNTNGKAGAGSVAKAQDIGEHDVRSGRQGDIGSEDDDGTSEEYADESFGPLEDVDEGGPAFFDNDAHHDARLAYNYRASNGGGGPGGGARRDGDRGGGFQGGHAPKDRVEAQGIAAK